MYFIYVVLWVLLILRPAEYQVNKLRMAASCKCNATSDDWMAAGWFRNEAPLKSLIRPIFRNQNVKRTISQISSRLSIVSDLLNFKWVIMWMLPLMEWPENALQSRAEAETSQVSAGIDLKMNWIQCFDWQGVTRWDGWVLMGRKWEKNILNRMITTKQGPFQLTEWSNYESYFEGE